MYETLTVLKDLPAEVTSEEFLVSKVLALDIDEPEMKREHKKQLAAQAKSSQHHNQVIGPRVCRKVQTGQSKLSGIHDQGCSGPFK